MKRLGLYIHIPFCKKRCAYCDFVSSVSDVDFQLKYIEALKREIATRKTQFSDCLVDSIYFGGGTPSLLPLGAIEQILQLIRQNFSVSTDAEISMESNPESIEQQKVISYINAGVNRVSMGIQSLNDSELLACGRLHNSEQALEKARLLKQCGLQNISCDIIIGLPNQTKDSFLNTLDTLLGLDAFTHFSVYGLRVEEGTQLYKNGFTADDDFQADLYLQAVQKLAKYGFKRYEISNFAQSGFECRHNLKYWSMQDYLGLGASAHSFYNGVRGANTSDIQGYIEDFGYNEIPSNKDEQILEYIMLALRLEQGLNLNELKNRLGFDLKEHRAEALKQLVSLNIVTICDDTLKICDRFVYTQNQVLLKLL